MRTSASLRLGRNQDRDDFARQYFVAVQSATVESAAPKTLAQAVSLNYNWVTRHIDSIALPTRGTVLAIETAAGYTYKTLAETGPFARGVATMTGYHPLGGDWNLQWRLQAGEVFARSATGVPDTLLFRAGGQDSVRGYGYRELGPLVNGAVTSGRMLFTSSVDALGFEIEGRRLLVERAFAPVSRDGGLKEAVQLFECDFALVVSDQIAFRIDHPQRRPHVDRVPLPQHQLRIIHHGMSDAVPKNRLTNVLGLPFRGKLRRVHADHHQRIGVFLFELLQLRQDVHAVDAAVGPEVEHHELAAERCQFQRLSRVHPLARAAERRSRHGSADRRQLSERRTRRQGGRDHEAQQARQQTVRENVLAVRKTNTETQRRGTHRLNPIA